MITHNKLYGKDRIISSSISQYSFIMMNVVDFLPLSRNEADTLWIGTPPSCAFRARVCAVAIGGWIHIPIALVSLSVNHEDSAHFIKYQIKTSLTGENSILLGRASVWEELCKMTESIFEKNGFDVHFDFFSLAHLPHTSMEEVMTYTAASMCIYSLCMNADIHTHIKYIYTVHFMNQDNVSPNLKCKQWCQTANLKATVKTGNSFLWDSSLKKKKKKKKCLPSFLPPNSWNNNMWDKKERWDTDYRDLSYISEYTPEMLDKRINYHNKK